MKYNTAFFIESGVPDLLEHVCQKSRQKTLRDIMVHIDNVRPHNSRKSEATLTATKALRIPAPAHSPDPSPSDFFLFEILKERMQGTVYGSPDEITSVINELIASLRKDQLVSVYQTWMKYLN
jgi:hypothetical protein